VYCLHCNGLILVAFGEEHVAGQRTCIHCGAHNVFSSEDGVLVQREMESGRFAIASVPPLRGGDFQGMGKSIEVEEEGEDGG